MTCKVDDLDVRTGVFIFTLGVVCAVCTDVRVRPDEQRFLLVI